MKLTTTTQVSVDGVMQGNGGRHPDIDGGFERGGWARPLFDSEAMTFVDQVYQRADAFLFGRRTYEFFVGYWGVMDPGSGPIADALNTRPKYVASTTLTEGHWADTTVLSGDLAAAIGELKNMRAGELQVHGSGALIRWLLENDLVDEMNLLVCPVVVGQGTRLFAGTGPDMALDLVRIASLPEGHYGPGLPAGRAPAACNRLKRVTQGTHETRLRPRRGVLARHRRPTACNRELRRVGSLTTGVPESPRKESGRRCRIGAEVFVAGVGGRPPGAPLRGEGNHDMRLTITTNVSVDGVMQGLGGRDEDRRGGFERGGWALPLLDTEAGDHINEVYGGAAAFLFGLRTYEIFAGSWGAIPEMSTSPVGAALNSRPKYVVSTSLTDPRWAGTRVLTGDVAAAVGDLKAQQDGELLVPGSGVLVRWLLAYGLVDRLDLLTYPVVVGQGTRLFPDSGPDTALELVTSRSTPGGITIQTYRPAGRPKYAT